MKKRIRILMIATLIMLAVLASTFIVPLSFSGINPGFLCSFWLLMSDSGGSIGVPLITLFFCGLIGYYQKSWRKRMITITVMVVFFGVFLGGCAKINERVIKEYIHAPRPYTELLKNAYEFETEKFYELEGKEERSTYLNIFLQKIGKEKVKVRMEAVDPAILEHWIEETGFSFPSGHSVNAFMMATFLGYIILYIYGDGYKRRFLFILPFVWALLVSLSRVAVGAHSPTDITVGAFMGTLFACLVIITGFMDKIIEPKERGGII